MDILRHPWIESVRLHQEDALYALDGDDDLNNLDTQLLPGYDDELSSAEENDDEMKMEVLAAEVTDDGSSSKPGGMAVGGSNGDDPTLSPLHQKLMGNLDDIQEALKAVNDLNRMSHSKPVSPKVGDLQTMLQRKSKELRHSELSPLSVSKTMSPRRSSNKMTKRVSSKSARSQRASEVMHHHRKESLLYMNNGTIYGAQRDHLQRQKERMERERDRITAETVALEKQRVDLVEMQEAVTAQQSELRTMEQHLAAKQSIFEQEQEKWLAAKGSVEAEKLRLQKLQSTLTERYEAEFDKFVSETREHKLQCTEELKALTDERTAVKLEHEEITKLMETLRREREQFEADRHDALPDDIQQLRLDLKAEWVHIAERQKELEDAQREHDAERVRMQQVMASMAEKERGIDRDREEVQRIKTDVVAMSGNAMSGMVDVGVLRSSEFVAQQHRELTAKRMTFEAEKAEFMKIKDAFIEEHLPDDDDESAADGHWKQKFRGCFLVTS